MVIADFQMPDVDGVALLKEVREIDANIIRMIMTEEPGPEATKALAEADIQQIIAKPWDEAELTEIVRSAFEQTAGQEMEMLGLHHRAQIGSSGCGTEPEVDADIQESLGISDGMLEAVKEQVVAAAG